MSSTTVYVYTSSRIGEVGAWSRYLLPFHVDNFCHLGGKLYIRAENDVLVVDENATQDFAGEVRAQPFDGIVQWPYLDFGSPGRSKSMAGLDVSSINASSIGVEIGWDQSDTNAFTTQYDVPGDTVPGEVIPMPVVGASFSIRLTFSSYDKWKFQSITLYLNDQQVGP